MRNSNKSLIVFSFVIAAATVVAANVQQTPSWRTDSAWHDGKAEFALYDAVRPLYGVDRRYEARIFTNKQQMDPETTTKASDWRDEENIEVFKHNVSELIETENYTYRFLTTSFVRTDTLVPYKIVASSQEDCGSGYRQFVIEGRSLLADSYGYFPGEGYAREQYEVPSNLAFHDALTLTLRDFPFESTTDEFEQELTLIVDQTDNHTQPLHARPARLRYLGTMTIEVPYGTVECFHLVISHDPMGGVTESHYWFAIDPQMRHVLVQYEGAYGVRYKLKKFAWWAYWDRSQPEPE